ncbi:hypothetical protein [Mesorhizobium sp. RIZ17]|uniref:hypothetical protein n=1 Tax=Mesorhizobium sp. RIZ17 TaxID=3132743 RepID=UPI003DA7DE03
MHVETTGVARIRHRDTGEEFEIERDELEWEATDGDGDRQMGPETIYTAEIAHPDLGDLRWELSEYPVGVTNHVTHNFGAHELLEDFDIAVILDPEDAEEPFELTPPPESDDPPGSSQRYYAEDDDFGITAAELANLTADRQVPYLTFWFLGYHEDPAHETPYNGREGGYLYVHGGPYNADDELATEFGGFASDEAIELAVEEIQADGIYDWAPTSAHPDRRDEGSDYEPLSSLDELEIDLRRSIRAVEAGEVPQFGTSEEREARFNMRSAFVELAARLPPRERVRGGIGDNNPPPDERFTQEELDETREAAETVLVELEKDEPDIVAVSKASGILVRIAKYVGRKADMAVDAMAKSFGTGLGIAAVGGVTVLVTGLYEPLVHALGTIGPWLETVFHFLI